MLGRVTGYLPFRIEVFGELRSIWSSIRFFLPVTFLPITKAFAVKHIKIHFPRTEKYLKLFFVYCMIQLHNKYRCIIIVIAIRGDRDGRTGFESIQVR